MSSRSRGQAAVTAIAARATDASVAASELTTVAGTTWRRSLKIRVVSSTVALSSTVVLVLGVVLQAQLAQRLIENKTQAALVQADNSRVLVESELGAVDPTSASLAGRLTTAIDRLTTPDPAGAGPAPATAGAYEPVLVDGGGPSGEAGTGQKIGPLDDVPAVLQSAVERGALAHKITTVRRGGAAVTMLVVGLPVASAGRTLQLYLLFPLTAEQRTLTLVQSTLVVGGVVLLILIAGIASLVSRQVVVPIRQAAEVAERFADGHLDERMPVVGEDDIARLGTSFNEMAASIQRQIRQLEEFGELQRGFTSDVSHELRTPLTTVRMAADLLYDSRDKLHPVLHRPTELLVRELDRFEALLADLLEISRVDAGVAELHLDIVDLRTTVAHAVAAVRAVADRTGTPLELEQPSAEVYVEIDPPRVERIVRNLLTNALDHGEGRPVQLTVAADADAVAVLVRDHGVGLRPGQQDLVFNRFWRGDPSRDRRTGGTGLGLSISLEDARLHGGWLQAWGAPGEGSAFRLTLPRSYGRELAGSPLPLGPDSGPRTAAVSDPQLGNHKVVDPLLAIPEVEAPEAVDPEVGDPGAAETAVPAEPGRP
ncbi:MAG TPA: MtrAB system histidine kinase MtrB [Pseudonocardiaceae bacterium]|nr:MtrAB system histidine kinase MtrB [Pseudonocardiaceae bacterium]